MESMILTVALPIFVASIVVFVIHPHLVKIAKMKMIVDNPNARKLNKEPVPVLGGVGVFFGLMFGIGVAGYYTQGMNIQFELIVAMMVMLYTGVGDDILDLSPTLRFALQIFTVCMMMFLCGIYIDNFHGLWGIYKLPLAVAVLLTLVSCVGIINSINLIDGVDGLCSSYGMFASLLYGICFIRMGDVSYAVMAFSLFGSLIPFLLHNVFGRKYKMFLGDGGIGNAEKLCDCGIYGQVGEDYSLEGLECVYTADIDEVEPGNAYICSTVNGECPKKYTIDIVKVDKNNKSNKNFVIKITDKDLISATGGIVQGMSGSPILQDGKLVGAVTHVFLNDPTRGYGIDINTMLKE